MCWGKEYVKYVGKLVRRVDNIVTAKLVAAAHRSANFIGRGAPVATAAYPDVANNALARGLAEALVGHHVDLVGQGDNDVLVGAKLEVVGLDIVFVALDLVGTLAAAQDALEVPLDDIRTGGGNDASLLGTLTSVKLGRCKADGLASLVVELRNVLGCEG